MKKNLKTKTCIAIGAISILASHQAIAEIYTEELYADGTHETVNAGDTYYRTEGSALHAANEGEISLYLYSGGLNINLGAPENPVTNYVYGVVAESGGSINLGHGTNITGYNEGGWISGLTAFDNGSFIGAERDLTINIVGPGTSFGAVAIASGTIDLGTNANIYALDAAIYAFDGGNVFAYDGKFDSSGSGLRMGAGYTTIRNSSISGSYSAIYLDTNAEDQAHIPSAGYTNIYGGTLYSEYGAVIASGESMYGGTVGKSHYVVISEGAKASSGSGILFENLNVDPYGPESSINIMVDGVDTVVEGRFLDTSDNQDTALSIMNHATWSSKGSSHVDSIYLSNANVEFVFTNANDKIDSGYLGGDGENIITINFDNDFIEEILDGSGSFTFNVYDTIVGSEGVKDYIEFIIADTNGTHTWDVTNLGEGNYMIGNVSVIPEPAEVASVIGLLSLGLASYMRRRK